MTSLCVDRLVALYRRMPRLLGEQETAVAGSTLYDTRNKSSIHHSGHRMMTSCFTVAFTHSRRIIAHQATNQPPKTTCSLEKQAGMLLGQREIGVRVYFCRVRQARRNASAGRVCIPQKRAFHRTKMAQQLVLGRYRSRRTRRLLSLPPPPASWVLRSGSRALSQRVS